MSQFRLYKAAAGRYRAAGEVRAVQYDEARPGSGRPAVVRYLRGDEPFDGGGCWGRGGVLCVCVC